MSARSRLGPRPADGTARPRQRPSYGGRSSVSMPLSRMAYDPSWPGFTAGVPPGLVLAALQPHHVDPPAGEAPGAWGELPLAASEVADPPTARRLIRT